MRMSRSAAILTFGAIAWLGHPTEARSEELVTDLSEHLIAIRSNFTGTQILVFGAVETESQEIRALARDIVVVVRGPERAFTVRRKDRVAGIWMNYASEDFDSVPTFYAVVSTRPLEAIASRDMLERHQIGTQYLRLRAETTGAAARSDGDFRQATSRLMSRARLFSEVPGGVSFLGDTLFRARIDIPSNVPVGNYTVEVYLIRDGNVIHAQASPLFVNKTGFERFIYNLAYRQPLLYGLIAVALALVAGWLAAAAFRTR